MKTANRIALVLVIIGAINWGLIGLFRFDLVASIFGGQTAALSRIIYTLVGLSGLYSLSMLFSPMEETDQRRSPQSNPGSLNYSTEFADEKEFSNKDDHDRNR